MPVVAVAVVAGLAVTAFVGGAALAARRRSR